MPYEILSGHNRVNAARIAGLDTIPTIVRECTDDEAMLVVTTTNLIQRQFGEMAHSERAAVLSAHHNAIKKQGQRTDLVKEIENMLNASNDGENRTFNPMDKKFHSGDKTGKEYALSQATVARYLRVNMLIVPLKECLDCGEFGVRVGVSLSYLAEETQQHVAEVLTSTSYKLDMKKADELKAKQPTSRDDIERIIAGQKPKRPAPFRLKPKLVTKYFAGSSQREIESTLIAALDMYFAAQRKGE